MNKQSGALFCFSSSLHLLPCADPHHLLISVMGELYLSPDLERVQGGVG